MCCLKTLFDIDVEDTDVCRVIDAYMARAWRGFRAELHKYFKLMEGSKDETTLAKVKATPPSDIGKDVDWGYLCDRWSDPKFLVKF